LRTRILRLARIRQHCPSGQTLPEGALATADRLQRHNLAHFGLA
jgi:hypothetical protein